MHRRKHVAVAKANAALHSGWPTLLRIAILLLAVSGGFSDAKATGYFNDACPNVTDCTTTTPDPNQDNRYLNASIQGPMTPVDNSQGANPANGFYSAGSTTITGLQGSMPGSGGTAIPMPTKNTPAVSLIDNFPWMYKDIDQVGQYAAYRGTGNNTYTDVDVPVQTNLQDSDVQTSETQNTSNNSAVQTTALDQSKCYKITDTCPNNPSDNPYLPSTTDNPDYPTYERWVRLQYDSCSEQYILPMGLQPDTVFDADYRNHQFPWNENMCQPLTLKTVDCVRNKVGICNIDFGESDHQQYDYRAWGYLELAWKDLLAPQAEGGISTEVSGYVPNKGIANEASDTAGGGNGVNPVLVSQMQNCDSSSQGGSNIGKPNDCNGITGENKFGSSIPSLTIFSSDTPPGYVALPYSPTWGKPGPGNAPTTALNPNVPTLPYSGNLTTINQYAAHPYERIWDPTHPYTPRWDFNGMDRDYSQGTGGVSKQDAAHLEPITDFISPLGYTAGYGYDLSTSPCIVRCASVPVDILTFRQPEFNKCMEDRITANKDCFWSQVKNLTAPKIGPYCPGTFDPPEFYLGIPEAQAYAATVANSDAATTDAQGCEYPLWDTPGSTCKSYYDLEGRFPVCSTKYDYPVDNVPGKCKQAINDANDPNPMGGVTKCCNDLAQAVAPLNTLKIRNLKFDSNIGLSPSPEGYRFQDYFPKDSDGNPHMPFMRWWDTGTAAGGTSNHGSNYDPNSTCGWYDTIVGVGKDNGRCRYGGNGTANTYTCLNMNTPDALTSWAELKIYQMYTLRNYGLSCLAQYEKVYKQYATEDGALSSAGGVFNSYFPLPNDSSGKTFELKSNPWPLRWRGYLTDPNPTNAFPNFGAGGGTPPSTTCTGYNNGATNTTPPYTGPGCVSDGLDNAKTGDIIYITHNDVAPNTDGTPNKGILPNTIPFVAVVTGVFHSGTSGHDCQDFVEVIEVNNGKYPDVCGNTNYIGFGQTRRIYKDYVPQAQANATINTGGEADDGCGDAGVIASDPNTAYSNIMDNDNCIDPKLSTCTYSPTSAPFPITFPSGSTSTSTTLNLWNSFHIYRPTQDERN
jgi:hypothetical protein